jgi:hypothetical protein
VTSELKALLGELKMTLGRRCNVDHLRLSTSEHLGQVGKALRHVYSLTQLSGHEQFSIAKGYNRAIRNPSDSLHVLISHFAATDYGYTKHCI